MDPQIQVQTEDIPINTPDVIRDPNQLLNNDNLKTGEDEKLGNESSQEQINWFEGLNKDKMEVPILEGDKDDEKLIQDQQAQSEIEDIKEENPSSQASSDEDSALPDKAQILSMFTKMTKESIAKICETNLLESSEDGNEVISNKDSNTELNDNDKLIEDISNGNYSSDDITDQNDNMQIKQSDEESIESEGENIHKTDSTNNEELIQKEGNFDHDNLQIITDSEQIENGEHQNDNHADDILVSDKQQELSNNEEEEHVEEDSKEIDNEDIEDDNEPEPNNDVEENKHQEYDEDDSLIPSQSKPASNKYKDELYRILMASSKSNQQEDDQDYDDEDAHEYQLDEQMQEYLKNNGLNEQVHKHNIKKDGPATELSNDILSYERFFPGRILGNTFTIINKTNETVHIKVAFTREGLDKKYASNKLMEFYEVSNAEEIEQPYINYLNKPITDAEKEYECWFIEDPYAKVLVKEVEYELKPKESFEFIVVLKSPIIKKQMFLTTNVRVRNETHQEDHRVFAFGSLDVPKLSCPKEIMDKENNYAWVKVVMRKKVQLQVFKFLLVNKGDMPINVNFSSLENDEMLWFSFKNPLMVIEGGTRAILEVKALHKYKNIPDKKWKTMNNHKLIIGKIKDWELKFSLIVNVIIL